MMDFFMANPVDNHSISSDVDFNLVIPFF